MHNTNTDPIAFLEESLRDYPEAPGDRTLNQVFEKMEEDYKSLEPKMKMAEADRLIAEANRIKLNAANIGAPEKPQPIEHRSWEINGHNLSYEDIKLLHKASESKASYETLPYPHRLVYATFERINLFEKAHLEYETEMSDYNNKEAEFDVIRKERLRDSNPEETKKVNNFEEYLISRCVKYRTEVLPKGYEHLQERLDNILKDEELANDYATAECSPDTGCTDLKDNATHNKETHDCGCGNSTDTCTCDE